MQTDRGGAIHLDLPFYRQHWNYTCGPASLMMAMKHLDPGVQPDRDLEIDIWREGTFVVVPGTSRFGLAFSAAVRGLSARTTSNTGGIDYVETFRPPLADEDMALLKEHFFERWTRCRTLGVRERRTTITTRTIRRALLSNRIPLIVTSSSFYSDDDLPHWVVVTGLDDRFMYFYNPDDPGPRTRMVALAALEGFIGYHGAQSMVEVWRD